MHIRRGGRGEPGAPPTRRRTRRFPTASSRCCGCWSTGLGPTDIGEQLHLSVKTVSTHKTRILEKLNLGSTAELVRYALEHKLLD